MGRLKKPTCPYDEPDCLNCPFDECYATMKDINRQEALANQKIFEEQTRHRNERILILYQNGKSINDIALRVGLSTSAVRKIICKDENRLHQVDNNV